MDPGVVPRWPVDVFRVHIRRDPPVDRKPDDNAVRFLSLASHDLRGPLAPVRTYAALLRSPLPALSARQGLFDHGKLVSASVC